MNNEVEVVYGPNGEAYLALRKVMPKSIPLKEVKNVENSKENVIIIDMFEEDKICYEC